jgi:surfeit locus 1 family protein
VLVNRGWVAAGAQRQRAPDIQTPAGEIVVRGMAAPFSERYIELSTKVAEGNVWQNVVRERYQQATGLNVLPIVLQQTGAMDDGLTRDWPPVDLKRNMHLAYAVQWFVMAAAIFLTWLFLNARKKSNAG